MNLDYRVRCELPLPKLFAKLRVLRKGFLGSFMSMVFVLTNLMRFVEGQGEFEMKWLKDWSLERLQQ